MNDLNISIFLSDKKGVARNFNAAADCYEDVAVLQQTVANRLDERLGLIKIDTEKLMDLGSGTGMGARLLSKRYRKSDIVQTDIASNMLCSSRRSFPRFFSRQSYVCADAEQLPFRDGKYDLVYSNLMLQWCNNLDQVFTEINRILRTGGVLIFSSFGPDTLRELRDSWSRVDDKTHVNTFIDMHDIGDALIRSGFEGPVMETEDFTLTYENVAALMKELKQLGAQNVTLGRRSTLTGKGRIRRMINEYEKKREQGRLPATYEVIYGHAWRREKRPARPIRQSAIGIPVDSIKRRLA